MFSSKSTISMRLGSVTKSITSINTIHKLVRVYIQVMKVKDLILAHVN